jgi:hypothetical protein
VATPAAREEDKPRITGQSAGYGLDRGDATRFSHWPTENRHILAPHSIKYLVCLKLIGADWIIETFRVNRLNLSCKNCEIGECRMSVGV